MLDLYAQARTSPSGPGAVAYRAFDLREDGLSLGFARMTLAHAPTLFGFRVDAGVGDTANGYFRDDPASADHAGLARAFSYVQQAFVTAKVPVGQGLALDLGKFGTPLGIEDNEAIANAQYSRSLLYTLAEPTMHTGVRATYPFDDAFAVSAFWLNGWNANVVDGNGMRSFALAATLRPERRLELGATYAGGLERAPTRLADPTLSFRHTVDAYAELALHPRVSFAAAADYAVDAANGGVSFWGVAGYARARVLPWLAASVRAEAYADPDGFTSGVRQRIVDATATLEASHDVRGARVIGRLEGRRDRSDARAFAVPGAPAAAQQDTITAALLVAY